MSGTLSDEKECRNALEYVRQHRKELKNRDSDTANKQKTPLDQLERLKELKDDDAISENEFNEKKDELLDNI
jgi:Holliday junction resolvase RusA-like endonuclease